MKPTLLVLAAGMGSRYGGLKQLDGLGPNGETIMDYSIYDAIRAGFGKVVFVIRHIFEEEFREKVISKYEGKIPVELAFQEVENVPKGSIYDASREKPWGTNHAVLIGMELIKEPFAVINADDYYGVESFQILADYLKSVNNKQNDYCMIGYRVENTMSESGAVNRGVCETDEKGFLNTIVEREKIEKQGGSILYKDEQGVQQQIPEGTRVSMNMWGFTPDYFSYSLKMFKEFLKKNGMNIKSEFYIPTVVNDLIQSKKTTVKVLDTPSKWFGITYADDRPLVVLRLNELIKKGVYPSRLWEHK
ncbi:MAG: nucleotidyltransferase [Prevotellaceae bacterium]|nr:nucleotidyltransferase [Prevotellaceae bacterium]